MDIETVNLYAKRLNQQPVELKEKFFELYCELSIEEKKKLAVKPDLDPKLMFLLSRDENRCVRSELARRNDLSKDILENLSNDDDRSVVVSLASNKTLPDYLKLKMSESDNQDVRAVISARKDCPEYVYEKLSRENNNIGVVAFANLDRISRVTPENTSEEDGNRIEKALNRKSESVSDKLLGIIEEKDAEIERVIVVSEQAYDVYERRLQEKDERISELKKSNRNNLLPLSVVLFLSTSEDSTIRSSAAVLSGCVDDNGKAVGIPESCIYKLSKDPDINVRMAVARRDSLPLEIMENLSRDAEPVRRIIAGRSDLPENILENLVNDQSSDVKQNAFVNMMNRSDLSQGFLDKMASGSTLNDGMRITLIEGKHISMGALSVMKDNDNSLLVREKSGVKLQAEHNEFQKKSKRSNLLNRFIDKTKDAVSFYIETVSSDERTIGTGNQYADFFIDKCYEVSNKVSQKAFDVLFNKKDNSKPKKKNIYTEKI